MPVTAAQFRRIVLALPEASEGAHQAHPDFRLGGRVFASLLRDSLTGMVKVPLPLQKELISKYPHAFRPAAGAWGRAGCTYVTLEEVENSVVASALEAAWQHAAKPAPRKKRT